MEFGGGMLGSLGGRNFCLGGLRPLFPPSSCGPEKSASAMVWLHRRRVLASYEQISRIQKISTFVLSCQYESPAISTTESFC